MTEILAYGNDLEGMSNSAVASKPSLQAPVGIRFELASVASYWSWGSSYCPLVCKT